MSTAQASHEWWGDRRGQQPQEASSKALMFVRVKKDDVANKGQEDGLIETYTRQQGLLRCNQLVELRHIKLKIQHGAVERREDEKRKQVAVICLARLCLFHRLVQPPHHRPVVPAGKTTMLDFKTRMILQVLTNSFQPLF